MKDFFAHYAHMLAVGTDDQCWPWTGAKASKGYGHGYRHRNCHRQHFYAHRSAYEAVNGDGSASGLVVRHKCDNPPCCNPAHLEIGTNLDNSMDAWARGRMHPALGEAASHAKLKESDVLELRELFRSGVIVAELGRRFGISFTAAKAIVKGRTWRHLITESTDAD